MASYPKPVVTGYPAATQPSYAAAAGCSAGTAYSYSYPPPPPYYPPARPQPAYYPAPAQHPKAALLRRLVTLIIAALVVVGAATLIVWLILRPRAPELSVSSLRVSSFNLSSSLLSSDFDLDLAVRNPNTKLSASYSHVAAAVFFRSDNLAETSLPPLFQAKRNSTSLHARMVAVGEYVDPDVASAIQKQRASSGGLSFDVRLSAVVRFQTGGWWTRSNFITVYCGDVRVTFSNATASTAELAGPPVPCRVNV